MSENPLNLIKNRLSVLTSQRDEMRAKYEAALMPISTAIAELQYLLTQLESGNGTMNTAPVLQMPQEQFEKPVDITVSEKLVVTAAPKQKQQKDDPRPVILSPKSKTPILSNTATLKRLMGR